MDIQTGLFYVFSGIMLLAAFRVITARNPVHAVLFLVLAFFQAAMIWMLLKAEFLAISLVLVYVGAVMVLFLFVVMMMDIRLSQVRQGFWRHFPLAAAMGVLVALEMAAVLLDGFRFSEELHASAGSDQPANARLLGRLLYTQYLYPLEIAAAILLVAMIAAIALTLRQRKDSKHISPAEQVRAKPQNRLRVLKMPATTHPDKNKPKVESRAS